MNKKSKIGLLGLVVVAIIVAAVRYFHGKTVAILSPKGPVAAQERHLIFFGLLLSLVVVVPVFIMAFLIAWRYRETNTKAKYTPDWDHSALAETIWWGVPTLLITILSVVAWQSSHTLDPSRPLTGPTPAMTIQVVALPWKWLFIYPQQNIASVNLVQFPANVPVAFQITADAPMNSFWIPQLGGQIYAMPGMSTQLHLMAYNPGHFYGSSANISGRGFAGMHFMAQADTAAAFYKWVASAQHSSARLDLPAYRQLAQPSTDNRPASYALRQPGLYNIILAKYMAPGSVDSMNMAMTGATQ